MATKKSSSSSKKSAKKKPGTKKETEKKADIETELPEEETGDENTDDHLQLETITVQAIPEDATNDFPEDRDCACMQKKPNGRFFCFKLIQGRWVQSSAIPFATKEMCEEANC